MNLQPIKFLYNYLLQIQFTEVTHQLRNFFDSIMCGLMNYSFMCFKCTKIFFSFCVSVCIYVVEKFALIWFVINPFQAGQMVFLTAAICLKVMDIFYLSKKITILTHLRFIHFHKLYLFGQLTINRSQLSIVSKEVHKKKLVE